MKTNFFNILIQSLLIIILMLCIWTAVQVFTVDTQSNVLKLLQ